MLKNRLQSIEINLLNRFIINCEFLHSNITMRNFIACLWCDIRLGVVRTMIDLVPSFTTKLNELNERLSNIEKNYAKMPYPKGTTPYDVYELNKNLTQLKIAIVQNLVIIFP